KTLIVDMVHSFLGVYPHVSFELIHNREKLLFSSGAGDNLETLSILFHRTQALEMFEVPSKKHPILGMSVRGFLSKPRVLRSSNKDLKIFVNNRIVKHPPILRAILVAYEKNIPDKKWPIGLFFIQIPPRMIDVNVHPMKLEIRIENEQILQEFITKNIRAALLSNDLTPTYLPKEKKDKAIGFFEGMTSQQETVQKTPEQEQLIKIRNVPSNEAFNPTAIKKEEDLNLGQYKINAKSVDFKLSEKVPTLGNNDRISSFPDKTYPSNPVPSVNQNTSYAKSGNLAEKAVSIPVSIVPPIEQKEFLSNDNFKNQDHTKKTETIQPEVKSPELSKEIDNKVQDISQQNKEVHAPKDKIIQDTIDFDFKFEDFKLIGQLDQTFILGKYKSEFLMIDQHVAQERVLYEYYYERLKSEAKEAEQSLLIPAKIEIPSRLEGVLLENIKVFENLGFRFTCEDQVVTISALPNKFKGEVSKDFFIDLISQIEMNFASNDLEDYY
ncbi:DNA mismatch repair endonuclease MutL, partial [bacterium]|nr:DNA mismatch repair endonuclease MutL [bacterium]